MHLLWILLIIFVITSYLQNKKCVHYIFLWVSKLEENARGCFQLALLFVCFCLPVICACVLYSVKCKHCNASIDRLEVVLLFMKTLWICIINSLSNRKVHRYSYIKYCILRFGTGVSCPELQDWLFLGSFRYYLFVIIYFSLSIYYFSWFPTATTRTYLNTILTRVSAV